MRPRFDHTIAWADGGITDAGNLATTCRKHHTIKHDSRWTVERLDDQHGPGVLAWPGVQAPDRAGYSPPPGPSAPEPGPPPF